MSSNSAIQSSFVRNINQAVQALRQKNYLSAQDYIKHAMSEEPDAAEVHNLLGILSELTGDLSLAGKHFRAAYALDPSYKPASRNLARITSMDFAMKKANPDYGDKPEKQESSLYIVVYDDKNIGRLKKE